jgi:hypothetical protein
MGLTIHFKLAAPAETNKGGAEEIVRQLRRRALRYAADGRVDKVLALDDAQVRRWGRTWRFFPLSGRPGLEETVELVPLEGFGLAIRPGAGCEPLWLGLCRYPLTMWTGGRRRRTGLSGWRWEGFCKTQYASVRGWPHFLRCHRAVLGLLEAARRLGCRVDISDEGEYWPGRNETALRQNVDEMNRAVAAAAGALKDLDGTGSSAGVDSPIFDHPRLEQLEAEGAATGRAATKS